MSSGSGYSVEEFRQACRCVNGCLMMFLTKSTTVEILSKNPNNLAPQLIEYVWKYLEERNKAYFAKYHVYAKAHEENMRKFHMFPGFWLPGQSQSGMVNLSLLHMGDFERQRIALQDARLAQIHLNMIDNNLQRSNTSGQSNVLELDHNSVNAVNAGRMQSSLTLGGHSRTSLMPQNVVQRNNGSEMMQRSLNMGGQAAGTSLMPLDLCLGNRSSNAGMMQSPSDKRPYYGAVNEPRDFDLGNSSSNAGRMQIPLNKRPYYGAVNVPRNTELQHLQPDPNTFGPNMNSSNLRADLSASSNERYSGSLFLGADTNTQTRVEQQGRLLVSRQPAVTQTFREFTDQRGTLVDVRNTRSNAATMHANLQPRTQHQRESTSYGYDEQQQQNSSFMGCPSMSTVFNELLMMMNKPDATEDEIKELFESKNQYLPGYRFTPTDDKLLTQYLRKKIANEPIPRCFVRDVNVYQHHPKDITESYPRHDPFVDEWYFFSPRARKYPNGKRPKRAAGIGYWKATGADRPVHVNDEIVGSKQALVFYEGKAPKGVKTNWIMHEFKGMEKRERRSKDDMKLDDYVLCRIYCKKEKSLKEEEEEEKEEEEEEKNEEVKEEEDTPSKRVEANPDEPSYVAGVIIEANQNEVYKVPYEAGDIIEANQNEVYKVLSYEGDDIIEANQNEVYKEVYKVAQMQDFDLGNSSSNAGRMQIPSNKRPYYGAVNVPRNTELQHLQPDPNTFGPNMNSSNLRADLSASSNERYSGSLVLGADTNTQTRVEQQGRLLVSRQPAVTQTFREFTDQRGTLGDVRNTRSNAATMHANMQPRTQHQRGANCGNTDIIVEDDTDDATGSK